MGEEVPTASSYWEALPCACAILASSPLSCLFFFPRNWASTPTPIFLEKKLYKLGETFKNIIHILLPVSAPLIEKYYRGHILNIGQYKHIIKRNLPFRDMLPISLKNEEKKSMLVNLQSTLARLNKTRNKIAIHISLNRYWQQRKNINSMISEH